jgi:hypothetical protein
MVACDTIYGVNPNNKITPEIVRDAIIQCFYEAEEEVLDSLFSSTDFCSDEDKNQKKFQHVKIFIEKMFKDVNGDFNNPKKESLINVIDRCSAYAKTIRNEEIIKKHYNEIMNLIDKLE